MRPMQLSSGEFKVRLMTGLCFLASLECMLRLSPI